MSDAARKRRGRPSLGQQPADVTIGKTVHALLLCGFSLDRCGERPGVAEVVGQHAKVAKRADKLSGDRVKQLYRLWLADGWPKPFADIRRRAHAHAHQAKPWRRQFAPAGHSLATCAEKLLRNGGEWPADELSIKAWAQAVVLISRQAFVDEGLRIPELVWDEPEDRSPTRENVKSRVIK